MTDRDQELDSVVEQTCWRFLDSGTSNRIWMDIALTSLWKLDEDAHAERLLNHSDEFVRTRAKELLAAKESRGSDRPPALRDRRLRLKPTAQSEALEKPASGQERDSTSPGAPKYKDSSAFRLALGITVLASTSLLLWTWRRILHARR
jgi:hypothetical protein